MTICLATSNFPPQSGGIATFYGHLTSLLLKNDHRVIVVVPDENAIAGDEDEVQTDNRFIKVLLRKKYAYYRSKFQLYFRPGGLDAPGWIAAGLAMRDWLSENQTKYGINIVEVSDYGGLAAFLVDNLLPPVAVTGHGSYTQLSKYNNSKSDRHSKVIQSLEKISFQLADGIIAGSPLNQKELANLFDRQIAFSPAPFFLSTGNIPAKNSGYPVIIGGLQKTKGSITTADAVRLCISQNKNIALKWVGGDTYTAPNVQKMSIFLKEKYGDIWNSNFLWLGEQTSQKVMELIREASFIIIPSEWETFSYVALEAATLRKAIIMTDKTGASYLFTHGKDAWIIPANNPQSLAAAILYLTSHPEFCTALGHNAALTIDNVLNKGSILSERINIYTRIINNREVHPSNDNSVFNLLRKIQTPQARVYYQLRSFMKKIAGKK